MRTAIVALALFSVTACQKEEEAQTGPKQAIVVDLPPKDVPTTRVDVGKALERISEATRRDLYCAAAIDAMARRPGNSEEDINRLAEASGLLGNAGDKGVAAEGASNEDRVALFAWKEQVHEDVRRGEPKYLIADCLVRADVLKPAPR